MQYNQCPCRLRTRLDFVSSSGICKHLMKPIRASLIHDGILNEDQVTTLSNWRYDIDK